MYSAAGRIFGFQAETRSVNTAEKKKNDNQLKQNALNHPLVADAIEIFEGKLLEVKILKGSKNKESTKSYLYDNNS